MTKAIISYTDEFGVKRLRPVPDNEPAAEIAKWLESVQEQGEIHLYWLNKFCDEYIEYV